MVVSLSGTKCDNEWDQVHGKPWTVPCKYELPVWHVPWCWIGVATPLSFCPHLVGRVVACFVDQRKNSRIFKHPLTRIPFTIFAYLENVFLLRIKRPYRTNRNKLVSTLFLFLGLWGKTLGRKIGFIALAKARLNGLFKRTKKLHPIC